MSAPGLRRGLALLTGLGMLLGPGPGLAQDNINLYRFVLDVDVPESAALVALDETPTHVLLGAAPKPLMATLVASRTSETLRPGLALDVAPYFLFGGGVRSLSRYRSNSVAGRLMRVLTKTTLSAAVIPDATVADAWRVGFGLRTTVHDPHDPVLNSPLPEKVADALANHGVSPPGDAEEDVSERGVDLSTLFAEALRTMRARGDIQISGGWGVSARVEGDVLSADGLTDTRHTFWVTGQSALGPRFDALATVQGLDVWNSERALRAGAGVQRKTTLADFRAELVFDTTDDRLHPAVAIDLKLPGCTSVIAALATVPGPDTRLLRAQVQLRGYFAQCP
ncbi:hypothetical protein D7X74_17320 [Corallococcus sp. CA047B]|uniref:hypothetical protein n=1 Tax=Corallococcus sp. CA047B TaxID=2316729 RepID=UPI000EA1DCA1|nr:hypothetical protein [Corallococcus sp. CA047B]RKH15837.1 hypothetical protein D7X74_17320 [Corallococcus sp. CA047B]